MQTVVTRFNVFTCPCQQVNHTSLSTAHAYLVTYPFNRVSLLSAFHKPKTIFPQMLASTEQKPNLEQSMSELSKCLTVLSGARIRLPPNERVWMSAMYWLMWLRIGLINSAAEVAWPCPGWSLKNLTILVVKVVVLECKKWENNWSFRYDTIRYEILF